MQQEREIARMQRVVDRFGAKATKAAMAHNMERRIARLEADRVRAVDGPRSLRVRFPDPPSSGVTSLRVAGLCKGYGGPAVFEDVGFDIGRGERLLVLGLNGAGKTSLLRILAGETDADLGEIDWGHRVVAGYYAQEHDNLDGDASLLENMRRALTSGTALTETDLRGLLGMFGLSGDKVLQRAGTLSGGEKTKLALAMLMSGRNNLLLLDEPTNHLDIPTIIWLEQQLQNFNGAIVLITHDRRFLQAIANRIGELDRGQLTLWEGSYRDFVKHRAEQLAAEATANALFDKKVAQEEAWIRQGIKARRTRNEGRVRRLKAMREDRAVRRSQVGKASISLENATLSGKLVDAGHAPDVSGNTIVLLKHFSGCFNLPHDRSSTHQLNALFRLGSRFL